jgi:formiminotetrahydrofolate cyclodeaminase
MRESLWAIPTSELLSRTGSSEPTPGGGSIAAITGAFGVGLMQMALRITADPQLQPFEVRVGVLLERIVPAADADVADFEAVVSAYRLPRSDENERRERLHAIETATIGATERPLALVSTLVDAVELSVELETVVKPGIVSDVTAGRDIIIGAARAAIRTVDINLAELDRSGSARVAELRGLRDEAARRLRVAS